MKEKNFYEKKKRVFIFWFFLKSALFHAKAALFRRSLKRGEASRFSTAFSFFLDISRFCDIIVLTSFGLKRLSEGETDEIQGNYR